MKERFIGENIRLIFEIIDYIENNNEQGLLLFSDYEKAFDTLNHKFIIKCLQHFNFGNSFIRWIETFYKNITAVIVNNGFLYEEININRGVRQGCPLSSFLFILCMKILSNKISKDNTIKGINILKSFKLMNC